MQRLRPLTPLLVLVVQLMLAPSPASLAPTGDEDSVLSRFVPNAVRNYFSSSSSNGDQNELTNTDVPPSTTDAPAATPDAGSTDFVTDESQYQAILEQLQREAEENEERRASEERTRLAAEYERPTEFQERPSAAALAASESDEVDCAICLESLDDDESSRGQPVAVACGHRFHADCIGIWKHMKSQRYNRIPCPMCRRDISTGERDTLPELLRVRDALAAWQPEQAPTTARPAPTPRPRRSGGGVINRVSAGARARI